MVIKLNSVLENFRKAAAVKKFFFSNRLPLPAAWFALWAEFLHKPIIHFYRRIKFFPVKGNFLIYIHSIFFFIK